MSWDRDEAVRLYESGVGIKPLARIVGGPYTSVWRHLQKEGAVCAGAARVLIADIETAPMQAYVWSRWKQNVYEEQVISEGYVLCWAARWLGTDVTMTDSLFKNKTRYWRDPENDEAVVRSMWQLFDRADVVVFHNGDRFDVPVLNTRFLQYSMQRPSPYKTIDTYKIAKRTFKFPSAALDSMARYLGVGKKMDTGGFSLWAECARGNSDAWEKMVSYCAADVELLEKVYLRMRHWDHRHPNLALYEPDKGVCGVCALGPMIIMDQEYYTGVNAYSVYRCKSCGALSRSRVSSLSRQDREVLLTTVGK